MARTVAVWTLLLIVLVGVGIRTYHVTARSLWFDEAFSWRLTQFSVGEILARDALDVHPPLYYLLLKGWTVIFGSSLAGLRSFSITLAAATIALAYLFAAYAFSSRGVGLTAALFTALAGFQIQFAWEARMYTLGTALALLSGWLLLHALRQPRQRFAWWIAYALSAAAFAYTHYYAFFTIAAQGLFVLAYLVIATRGRVGEILQWRTAWYAAACAVLVCLLFLPWFPAFVQQRAQVQASFWIPPFDRWAVPDTVYRMFWPTAAPLASDSPWQSLQRVLPLAAVGLGLVALAVASRLRTPPAQDGLWLLLLSAVTPFILSSVISQLGARSLYQDRFLIFAHVYLLIAAAVLLSRVPGRGVKLSLGTAAVIGLLVADLSYWQELNILHKGGAHAAISYIMAERQADESIVASSPFIFFAIDHYAQEEYGAPGATKLYAESGAIAHFAGQPILKETDTVGPTFLREVTQTLWVVDTTGFGASPLALSLDEWNKEASARFPEVHAYQGDVIATKYKKVIK